MFWFENLTFKKTKSNTRDCYLVFDCELCCMLFIKLSNITTFFTFLLNYLSRNINYLFLQVTAEHSMWVCRYRYNWYNIIWLVTWYTYHYPLFHVFFIKTWSTCILTEKLILNLLECIIYKQLFRRIILFIVAYILLYCS